jgi:hypothetical protein
MSVVVSHENCLEKARALRANFSSRVRSLLTLIRSFSVVQYIHTFDMGFIKTEDIQMKILLKEGYT